MFNNCVKCRLKPEPLYVNDLESERERGREQKQALGVGWWVMRRRKIMV